jgi:four helix bundle protein
MFIALDTALDLITALRPIVPAIAKEDRELADQIRRAASSVPLNLGEGQRSAKGNKQKHYAIAHGSANEVKVALRTAQAWGLVQESALVGPYQILDRLLAMLWGLTH